MKIIYQAQFLTLQAKVDVKSVNEDDAILPLHLWDDVLFSTYPGTLMLEGKYRQYLWTTLNKFR